MKVSYGSIGQNIAVLERKINRQSLGSMLSFFWDFSVYYGQYIARRRKTHRSALLFNHNSALIKSTNCRAVRPERPL